MRQLSKTAILLFVLASFLTLMAAAQTSGSSSSTSQPSASSPSTSSSPSSTGSTAGQSGTTEASPAGQSPASGATSSPSSPAGAQSSGTAPAGGGIAAHPRTVEDELGLTADQKAKLQPIIDDEVKQINAVRDDNSLTMEQKQAKVDQIRQAGFPKIQAILTPEQRQKLADMQAQRTHQQQGGAPSSSPNNSQPPQ